MVLLGLPIFLFQQFRVWAYILEEKIRDYPNIKLQDSLKKAKQVLLFLRIETCP
jgi:hypothetical protein